jgi:hypothetical protein
MDALRDLAESLGTVINGVESGEIGEQRLGCADVARGFFASDMLFAGLESQAQGGFSAGVTGDADEAAGEEAFEGVRVAKKAACGSAESEGHTEALAVAECDVRAPFARRFEEGEGEEIGGGDDEGLVGMGLGDEIGEVVDGAVGIGVLEERAEDVGFEAERGGIGDDDLDAERFGAGADDFDGLGMAQAGDEEGVARLARWRAWQSVMASAAAVASSRSDALATSRPVRSQTMVWKVSRASSRPWAISAW